MARKNNDILHAQLTFSQPAETCLYFC